MRYFDPARPRAGNGNPQYLTPEGKPIAAIPHVYVAPHEDGTFILSAFLCVRRNAASHYSCTVASLAELGMFFQEYLIDPECALNKYFRYQGLQASAAPKPDSRGPVVTSLDQLLDD